MKSIIAICTLAVLLQATLGYFAPSLILIDFVLIAVVYLALQRDQVQAVVAGALAGIALDALSAGSILGANGLTEIKNANQAEIRGLEMELNWAATYNLMITGGLAFFDAQLTENYCGATDANGVPITVCPAGRHRSSPDSTVRSGTYEKCTPSNRIVPRACGSGTGCSGSRTVGSSSSTPESFSNAAEADWKVL